MPGDVRLVGYVVPTDDAAPVSEGELRRRLADSLPPYMVPSAIVTLHDLPLTPNGKIDRKSLPEPAAERTRGDSYVAPRTPLERRLVEIWEQDLGVAPIGVTDDFFDLGVTSIVAARLFARLERELGGRLPLGAVFQAPTIEKLAVLVESDESTGRWTSLVPIQPNGSEPPLFCVHGGAGTVLHLQPLAQLLGPEQPFYGLQARGLYGGAPPLLSVEEMAEHYLDELRTVQPEGPYYICRLLLRCDRRFRDRPATATRGRGGRPPRDVQRTEPDVDSPLWRDQSPALEAGVADGAAAAACPLPVAWSASSRTPRRCGGGLATFAGASGTGSSTPRVCASR